MTEVPKHDTVLDIEAEQLGKTYARALLGVAVSQNASDEVLSQLREISGEVLAANPQLAAAFASPRVSDEEKLRIIDRLFAGQVHPVLLRTMKVMAQRGRLGYLSAVSQAAERLHDEVTGRLVAEVRIAVPLTDELRSEVIQRLNQTFGKQVRLKEVVDPSLIGGMVIRVGDTVFDSSVASRINKVGRAARAGFAHKLLEQADRFAAGA